ncbi:MAG: sulfur carrier protein ThiS [Acidobacteriota bacterium]|nr:sulfur carrier protein ThiS [Acidobacteriota bacterium]
MVQTTTINVLVNGESREVPANQCVSSFLDLLEVTSDRVAVELNKSLVRKREWANTPVKEGAQIEIVEFVGGG